MMPRIGELLKGEKVGTRFVKLDEQGEERKECGSFVIVRRKARLVGEKRPWTRETVGFYLLQEGPDIPPPRRVYYPGVSGANAFNGANVEVSGIRIISRPNNK